MTGRAGTGGRSSSGTRLEILARTVAALPGGYGLAALTAVLCAAALPLPRSEAVLAGTMASFVVWVATALWAFAASTAARAWIGLTVGAAAGVLAWSWTIVAGS